MLSDFPAFSFWFFKTNIFNLNIQVPFLQILGKKCVCVELSFLSPGIQVLKWFSRTRWSLFCLGSRSTNWNFGNFHVPISATLTKNPIYPVSHFPKAKPTLGLLIPNQVDSVAPANQIFLFVSSLLFILYPVKASCFSPHFAVLRKETIYFHEVLNKVCLYHLNCL